MKLASNIELIMASSMSSGMSAAQAILNQSVLWVVPPNRWLAIAQTVNCRNESRRESFLNSLGAAMISMSPRQWHALHVSEKDILRNKFFFAFFEGPKWNILSFKNTTFRNLWKCLRKKMDRWHASSTRRPSRAWDAPPNLSRLGPQSSKNRAFYRRYDVLIWIEIDMLSYIYYIYYLT